MKPSHVFILAWGLLAATGSFATQAPKTIGDRPSRGEMTQRRFDQPVAFTGLTPARAKSETLDQVVAKRWRRN